MKAKFQNALAADIIKAHFPDATIVARVEKRIIVDAVEYQLSNGQFVYESPFGVRRKKDGTAYESV